MYSNEFGETTIPFHINVVDRLPSDQTVVIVVAVLGSVAVVATAALLIRIYLNTKKKGKVDQVRIFRHCYYQLICTLYSLSIM